MEESSAPAAGVGGPPPRVFVGISVAPAIAGELARLAESGLAGSSARIVAPADIHLTLVPPWNEVAVAQAAETLACVAGAFDAFPLIFDHVGYGPERRRPRLLWAACATNDEIVALHAALLAAFGQSEARPFRPHVTLARIRGNGAAIARKHPIDQEISLTQAVDSVELFRSPPPGETGYRILAASRLATSAGSV